MPPEPIVVRQNLAAERGTQSYRDPSGRRQIKKHTDVGETDVSGTLF